MDRKSYKQNFYREHYERIYMAVPKGMKQTIREQASAKGMSVNAYLLYLVRQDREGEI
ncbi:MAG: hypothetical protein Q4C80_00870 [Bacillota bacterium]|nr:hypothetical protein [Bacillota bacterium]